MEVARIPPFTKEYWEFVYIASKSFPLHTPLIIWASLRKMADVIVCKLGGAVIGGFVVTDLPLNTFLFRPKNFFSAKKRGTFKKLIEEGYRYLTYVAINKRYRGNGYGLIMMEAARENYNIKSYFTPFTAELQKFYEKSGATIYTTKDGKTLEGLVGPVMVFEGKTERHGERRGDASRRRLRQEAVPPPAEKLIAPTSEDVGTRLQRSGGSRRSVGSICLSTPRR